MITAFIGLCYTGLVFEFGWPGLLVGLAHIGVLLLATKR